MFCCNFLFVIFKMLLNFKRLVTNDNSGGDFMPLKNQLIHIYKKWRFLICRIKKLIRILQISNTNKKYKEAIKAKNRKVKNIYYNNNIVIQIIKK